MFFGTVRSEIDSKGKLSIPEQWRFELRDGLVVTRGVDACLCIFPRDKFEAIAREFDQWGIELTDMRSWSRFLSGSAAELTIDRGGDIEIPGILRVFAGLERQVSLIGVTSRIEIWNPSKRDESESRELLEMYQIAERIGKMKQENTRQN